MSNSKHIIVYSHGFGVKKDDNGLFFDIAAGIPEAESVLFDYYQVNEEQGEIYINSLSAQVKKLAEKVDDVRKNNPQAIIDLIAHSHGTILAAIAKPLGIRKAILLAPVFDFSVERSLNRYCQKADAEINLEGISKIPSKTALTKIIVPEYWQERAAINPFQEYNTWVDSIPVTAIIAKQDEIIEPVPLDGLSSKVEIIYLDGDHGFSGKDRGILIEKIRELLL